MSREIGHKFLVRGVYARVILPFLVATFELLKTALHNKDLRSANRVTFRSRKHKMLAQVGCGATVTTA